MADQTTDEFLKDLEPEEKKDVLNEPLVTEPEPAKEEEEKDEDGFKAKNRRERRLVEQNQRLREEAIAATARLQGISEARKFTEEVGEDPLKKVEAIFGTDTPEKREATEILKDALKGMSESAVQKTIEKLEAEKTSEAQALQQEERNIDNILDSVEDNHGIDMSNEAERKGFLTLLEKLSPKDANGDIIEYADPDATAEFFLSRKEKPSSRAKDLASRSMTRSGASQASRLEDDATLKYLKDNDLI